MTDEITLTIPRDRALYSVAHLVLGGVGIRLNLTIEHLKDLQLAVDAVLERVRSVEQVTIKVGVSEAAIETAIGPMRDGVRALRGAKPGEAARTVAATLRVLAAYYQASGVDAKP